MEVQFLNDSIVSKASSENDFYIIDTYLFLKYASPI